MRACVLGPRPSARILSCVLLLWTALSAAAAVAAGASADAAVAQQLAVVTTDVAGDVLEDVAQDAPVGEESKGPVVRCRMCGATIAHKHDHMDVPDASKAVSSRYARDLGGDIHTFVNPSRVEMELVAFKQAIGIEGEAFTSKATFFEGYSWKDLRCSGCNRHIGWKFHHDDFQGCIHTNIMESVSNRAKEQVKPTSKDDHTEKRELVRKELEGKCITANAGWWSYEVCYGKEVRQYHEEQDGTRPSDWSMGVFVADDKKLQNAETSSGVNSEVAQYFTGGQHCDENGELRSTKVLYTCCKTRPATVTIDNVEEPSLCSYLITVCVPSLCVKPRQPETPYNNKAIVDKCESEFSESHTDKSSPSSFAALRWATVISDDSSELDWARNLDFKT